MMVLMSIWYLFGAIGINYKNGCNYAFKLCTKDENGGYNYIYEQAFTVGELTEEDKQDNKDKILNNKLDEQNKKLEEQTNAINNQTEAIKENHETSKNIFQKIGDILSFINPFSENFFAYKLLDLLYEGLKALFIPSDEFFSDWFMDLNDTFSEQFGILYYPVSAVLEFFQKLEPCLTAHNPVINVPEFRFNFLGANAVIWSATSYNLNSLLENSQFETVHNYYLMFVNVILTIGLIAFASKIATEIFGGIDDTATQAYDKHQANKVESTKGGNIKW